MAIFAMSDLHLPLGIHKPMDIFGDGWENYVERISANWSATVGTEDTVLIGGDVSWATYLEEALPDFQFINALPGKKILSKGNHDYWWTTAAKLNAFKEQNGLDTLTFLHNNSVLADGYAICACRGWKSPFESDFSGEDRKIYEREMVRLELSLSEGAKLSEKRIVMMHYPPDVGFAELLTEYNVHFCVYGHLHGRNAWNKFAQSERDILVSADYLKFEPKRIVE